MSGNPSLAIRFRLISHFLSPFGGSGLEMK